MRRCLGSLPRSGALRKSHQPSCCRHALHTTVVAVLLKRLPTQPCPHQTEGSDRRPKCLGSLWDWLGQATAQGLG